LVADACAFCCTRGLGCNAHPAFPAPSYDFEGGLLPTTRTFRAARTRTHISHTRHAPRRRGIQYAEACRLRHDRFWILDRPVKPGEDDGESGCLKFKSEIIVGDRSLHVVPAKRALASASRDPYPQEAVVAKVVYRMAPTDRSRGMGPRVLARTTGQGPARQSH